MTIIAATHSPINTSTTRRPFGVGLVEPAPDVTGDWRSEVRACMRSLNYNSGSIGDVLKDLKARGTCRGSEGIEDEDVATVDALFARYNPTPAAPAPASAGPLEPSAEDRLWWFQQCDAADRERLNPNGIRKSDWRPWRGKGRDGRAR